MSKVYCKPQLEISTFLQSEVLATSAEVDSNGLGLDFTNIWGGNKV